MGETEYPKWVVIIPPAQVDQLGWEEGRELESIVEGNKLVIKPLINPPSKQQKTPYEEFRDRIEEALKAEPKGLTWTEIKQRLGLPQKVPNNKWVRMMEKDIGLVRETDKERGVVWRLK